MENSQTLLQGSSDMEKGAYLGAIASIATADRQATPEEVEYLSVLADSAGLSHEQKEAVIKAANEISDDDVLKCLDVLKNSELKYSLVTDVIAFAKTDNNYSEEEQKSVQKMADYLGVNNQQFSLLDHFTEKAKDTNNPASSTGSVDEPESNDFLSSLGLKDKLQSAGINGSGLLKGLLGIAAPMLLAKMVTGGLNRNRGYGGGMFGGGGGMFGGGLGSVFSMLNGNRGFHSSGGLLSRIFGGGF
ncbi:TerB family tellurite resistance protein [Segetibacter koreensis]|uniref:TerB family tellurite resistance protein n=1 Tax=Segetibacter koreensis TaxID=398037 RepID=UPI00039B7069|nr:TerB family tellurite resistance protein [Segetibacter koreensis]